MPSARALPRPLARDTSTPKLRAASSHQASRQVWDNPVLWREICTWAYGRKVLIVRLIYIVIAVLGGGRCHFAGASAVPRDVFRSGTVIPLAAWLLVPLFLLSLVILNAMAVTSVTTERDGRSLDLAVGHRSCHRVSLCSASWAE